MKKRFSIRLLSYLIILILVLSAPLAAYAEEVTPVPAEEEADGSISVPSSDAIDPEGLSDTDEAPSVIQDEDGEYLAIELEEEDPLADGSLLEDAISQLAYEDDATDLEILEAAYELALDLLPPGTERSTASAFLSDLLASVPLDQALITGKDKEGFDVAWVIVRFDPELPYFILDPAADLDRATEEWTAFLLGADAVTDWTADEEFAADEWTEAHILSPEAYAEPEEDPAEDPEAEDGEVVEEADENDPDVEEEEEEDADLPEDPDSEEALTEDPADTEEDLLTEEDEAEPAEVKEDDKDSVEKEDADPVKEDSKEKEDTELQTENEEESAKVEAADAGTVVASGSCGAAATWAVSYDSSGAYTLTIGGRGDMTDYTGSSSVPWYNNYRYSIEKVVIGKNITSIGDYAFYGLYYLTDVKFNGTNVSFIGDYAFASCSYLSRISVPSGVRSIGRYAFYNCYNLTNAYFPAALTTVGDYAFYYCSSLSSVRIPLNIITLGYHSFYNLSDIYFPSSSTRWQNCGGPNAIGDYTTVHFTKSLTKASVTLTKAFTYNGKTRKPLPVVKLGTRKLVKGTDYTLSYSRNKNAGTAKVTIKGIGKYSGSITKTFQITRRPISKNVKVTGVKNMAYTGKAVKLSSLKVKVKLGGTWKTLKAGKDYTLSYSNNKKISTSTSKAKVTITGKGNYKGKIGRSFKIVKAAPKLAFKTSSLARKVNTSTFTVKLKTKKTNGAISWSSSNKNVATVNKTSGKVTVKAIGSAKITVASKATKQYKAGKKSYKLTVKPLKLQDYSFSFCNSSDDFGYGEYDSIPLSDYQITFSPTQARWLYNQLGTWGGSCTGICAASAMIAAKGNGVTVSSFNSSAKTIDRLALRNYSSKFGINLKSFINALHVGQYGTHMSKIEDSFDNRIGAIIDEVSKGKKKGMPTLVSIWGAGRNEYGNYVRGGHQVLGMGIQHVSSTTTRINVYDPNFPGELRYITVTKSGSSYKWKYHMNDDYWWGSDYKYYYKYSGISNDISCIPYSAVKKTWDNRGSNQVYGYYGTGQMMHIDSADFKILDSDGNTIAVSANGDFSSYDPDVYNKDPIGTEMDGALIYLPDSGYQVVNTGSAEEEMTVSLVDVDQSVEVTTTAESVTLDLSDAEERNLVTVDAREDESFTVTLTSDLDSASGLEEVTFTGEGTGQEVTVGTEEGACVINNGENVTLAINGEEVAYVAADDEVIIEG